ncbi:MAG: hypothetical protein JXA35_06725 [Deltaproteobacteria bacterium]|nr:hypothetical protein [Deltaproteobacteria bacterium]
MLKIIIFFLFIALLNAPASMAEDDKKTVKDERKEIKPDTVEKSDPETKELSGMSIVGNDEAPKSLYIVPWKSSEIGLKTDLNMALNEKDAPLDRDVFKRKLEFYEISNKK